MTEQQGEGQTGHQVEDPLEVGFSAAQETPCWTHERIYDVAVSDGRRIGPNGRCTQPVGNTVDVKNANWTNTIGSTELIKVWKDPKFDVSQRAFYYARVLEIPTPRWTAYEAKRFGVDYPDGVPMTTQERAYTSPIWYTPGS